ncbi:hypothetical protein COLO4_09641 [Corchorus olitorius]|uniref:Aminotransferase-like plant mobile domain-containing protein n=1 Tax=Corchorus olitorius TaxID=93759 RepID=A0A1R3KBJ7_9ROSI|nr:hypothetical protein COLO4_09641 [Corchorus olitorius]
MVTPAGKNLRFRPGCFIKPSVGSECSMNEETDASIPRDALSCLPIVFEPRKWALKVKFQCWRHPLENWKAWVVKMAARHQSTWKKAGIFEAIMNSTYRIHRNIDLVFGVAEKWCHETKSFIFSWGEATITLEDVMILGGYSVLGSPVFSPVQTEKMEEIWEELNNARKEITRTTSRKASLSQWMKKFMDSGSPVEHEAFLAFWLSRYVLPSSFDSVAGNVLPIAIHLARGTRIALAPAILAKIYTDLSLLKKKIVATTRLESNGNDGNLLQPEPITLWSPLTLVQVWIWERFLELKPKPNLIKNGEPRFALWHAIKCKEQDVRSVLELAKEKFEWCPYVRKVLTNSDGAKFHGDKAIGISSDSSLDDELESFARCLRPSELVGLDCIEQYLPHRVALQFGMDQDIPGTVSRSNDNHESAWADYNKSVGGGKLNIPSRIFEAGVTTRYLKWWNAWWWNRSLLSMPEASEDALEEKTSFKIKRKRTEKMNKSDCFTSFKMIPKGLKRAKEGDGSFKVIPKKLKRMRNSNAFSGPKGLKRARLLSNQKEKGKKATSDLGSSRKRLKKLVEIPERKREVHTAQSSKAKKKDVLRPHESPPKGSEVSNEDKNGVNSAARLSNASKEVAPRFVTKMELNNSPFPPGFFPKPNHVQAKVSTKDDMVTPALPPGFPSKCIDEDEVTLVAAPPGINENCEATPAASLTFSLICIGEDKDESTIVEVSDFINEAEESVDGDKVTATQVLNLSEDSISDDEDQLTISEVLKSHGRSENVECNNVREGKNSSGHCQKSSSSFADKVTKTLVGIGNVIPTIAASGGSSRATNTIEVKTESCGWRSNGIPGDKAAAATVNCNSDEVETDVPILEKRIGRLEILVAYMKAKNNVKA